jgi:hypothetical protein
VQICAKIIMFLLRFDIQHHGHVTRIEIETIKEEGGGLIPPGNMRIKVKDKGRIKFLF